MGAKHPAKERLVRASWLSSLSEACLRSRVSDICPSADRRPGHPFRNGPPSRRSAPDCRFGFAGISRLPPELRGEPVHVHLVVWSMVSTRCARSPRRSRSPSPPADPGATPLRDDPPAGCRPVCRRPDRSHWWSCSQPLKGAGPLQGCQARPGSAPLKMHPPHVPPSPAWHAGGLAIPASSASSG
jgi:hypothetical protein